MAMKKTLLEIVQKILFQMGSDQVSSIGDTYESDQVVDIIESVYENTIFSTNLPELQVVKPLVAVSSLAKPNYLKAPADSSQVSLVEYNNKEAVADPDKWEHIQYVTPPEFMSIISGRDNTATEVDSISDFNGVVLYIYNDRGPSYYTSFDDNYLVFDSYNKGLEATLQSSKSRAHYKQYQAFSKTDSFIMPVDDSLYPQIVADATARCFMLIKQARNVYAEKDAYDFKVKNMTEKFKVKDDRPKKSPYGRKHVG